MGFLDDFVRSDRKQPISKLSKNTIAHDRFDREEYESILEEMREFAAAEDRLTDNVETGSSAFADTFFALLKAEPRMLPPRAVRPKYQVNHVVMQEAQELKEYNELRMFSTGDVVATGLASVAMEPDLQTLFDKVKQEQKMADQLDQQMQQMDRLEEEHHDLDELMQQLESDDPGEGEQPGPVDYQQQMAAIEAAMDKLREEIAEGAAALDEALDGARAGMRSDLQQAYRQAIDQADDTESMAQMWGLEPGSLHRMNAAERIALAKRLSNERFRKIAELFGPMHRMAFAEQQRRTIHSNDEIYDVETGNDLSRILPMELLALEDPDLELEFLRRFYEKSLLQYKMRGEERLAKGGILYAEDGSGSMTGQPELWAKAVGLTLLQIAKSQNRPFYGIHFGGPRQYQTFDFRDTRNITLENVIAFAELHFAGGTSFETPLSVALDIMREEHNARGAVKADIVFCTDGVCGVDPKWLEEFKAEQTRLDFKVYGIIIGGHPDSEPLKTICDGRVLTVADLHRGGDIREVFRNL